MKPTPEILTLADTILWLAQQRKGEQNLNSAIHAVVLEVVNVLMEVMKENK